MKFAQKDTQELNLVSSVKQCSKSRLINTWISIERLTTKQVYRPLAFRYSVFVLLG